jgi:hypothetical protein
MHYTTYSFRPAHVGILDFVSIRTLTHNPYVQAGQHVNSKHVKVRDVLVLPQRRHWKLSGVLRCLLGICRLLLSLAISESLGGNDLLLISDCSTESNADDGFGTVQEYSNMANGMSA